MLRQIDGHGDGDGDRDRQRDRISESRVEERGRKTGLWRA